MPARIYPGHLRSERHGAHDSQAGLGDRDASAHDRAEPARACHRPPSVRRGARDSQAGLGDRDASEHDRAEPARACLRPPSVRAGLEALAPMKRAQMILVVDDEKTIADGLRMTLESEGYGVRTAGSVREALGALVQGDPHAAIVDLMLPDGDGLQLT